MEEGLPEALDRLIESMYVRTVRGRGRFSLTPMHSEVLEFVDDAVSSVDSSDHFLLRAFDLARRELMSAPIPERTEPKPVSGEIP